MGTRLTSGGATVTCRGGNPTDPPGDVAPWDSEMAKSHGDDQPVGFQSGGFLWDNLWL